MAPNLKPRDGVILGRIKPDSLRAGQVVVFSEPLDPSTQIVHRIVDIRQKSSGTYLVTKGDGNTTDDPFLVPEENVSGRVIMRLPEMGSFLAFVHSTYGFLVTVIIPSLVVMLYAFGRAMQEKLTNEGKLSPFFTFDLFSGF